MSYPSAKIIPLKKKDNLLDWVGKNSSPIIVVAAFLMFIICLRNEAKRMEWEKKQQSMAVK